MITFGSPCQDLSQIGTRNGFAGKKSSLFYQAMRIIEGDEICNKRQVSSFHSFGKTSRERFFKMTGWILQPCSSAFTGAEVSVPSLWMGTRRNGARGRADTVWRLLDAQY